MPVHDVHEMSTVNTVNTVNAIRNKTISLYIVTETEEHIHHSVGRCNRESE
jgi:hypothetical protein